MHCGTSPEKDSCEDITSQSNGRVYQMMLTELHGHPVLSMHEGCSACCLTQRVLLVQLCM